jgi:esterase
MTMKLYSRILGSEGKPLLVLHGLFGMSDNWMTHGKSWADAGFHVHLLDLRNHGQSPHDDLHTYQAMSDDVVVYMDEQGLSDALVIGHSMGGKVAMLLASQHPTLVARLVVVDIAPKGYPVHHQEIIDGLRSLDFDEISSRKEADEQLTKSIKIPSVRQFLLKSLHRTAEGKYHLRFNLDAIEENIQMVGEPLAMRAFFDKPTLFVAGSESNYIKPTDHDGIFRHFPKADVKSISGAGHWVHAEEPEAFYEMVTNFLNP